MSQDLALSWLACHSSIYPAILGSLGVTYYRTLRMSSIAHVRPFPSPAQHVVVVGKALSVREVESVLSQGPLSPKYLSQENLEGAGNAASGRAVCFSVVF